MECICVNLTKSLQKLGLERLTGASKIPLGNFGQCCFLSLIDISRNSIEIQDEINNFEIITLVLPVEKKRRCHLLPMLDEHVQNGVIFLEHGHNFCPFISIVTYDQGNIIEPAFLQSLQRLQRQKCIGAEVI